MAMTIAWVIGAGGLLGTALSKTLRRNDITVFMPSSRLNWSNADGRDVEMATMVKEFATQATTTDKWEIYWAAGIGAMSSTAAILAPETQTLTVLLQLLANSTQLMTMQGTIAFASSAGAVYAGSKEMIICERTEPCPTTAYGYEKLKQEDLLKTFAAANKNVCTLVARISTIYGPGQAINKQQGLLTHIARCILRRKSIQIYVPYDTIRDYIFVDDAAAVIISTMNIVHSYSGFYIKIIASEKPTTIAEIISTFRRITRRKLLIYTSASKLSNIYSRQIQFKSIFLPNVSNLSKTCLSIGIANLMTSEQLIYARSVKN